MSRPSITVCVATYNQRSFIETCLRSILDQIVDADVRVLVGDDASSDGTSEIIAGLTTEYGSRLQHLRRNPNLGAFANMRDLLGRAEGDLIARVDGDDYWLPGKLARQVAYLEENPQCTAVYTNAITVDKSGNRTGLFNDVGDELLDLPSMVRRGNFLNNSSVLFRAENLEGWGGIVYQIDYQVHLWQARGGLLGHIGEPLAVYRVAAGESLVTSNHERVRELYWQAIQSVPRNLISDDDYAHGVADFLRRVFYRSVRARDPSLFTRWVARVYPASPFGRVHVSMLVAGNALRAALKIVIGKMRGGIHRHVLYRR